MRQGGWENFSLEGLAGHMLASQPAQPTEGKPPQPSKPGQPTERCSPNALHGPPEIAASEISPCLHWHRRFFQQRPCERTHWERLHDARVVYDKLILDDECNLPTQFFLHPSPPLLEADDTFDRADGLPSRVFHVYASAHFF